MPSSIRPYLFLTTTTLGWSANSVVGKYAVGHISPLMLNSLRWTFALIVITLFAIPQLSDDRAILKRHWKLLFLYGMFGFTGYNALLYSSLLHTSAINCVIEQSAIPGLIFLGNYLLFRTRVLKAQIIGYSVTLCGVVLTAANGTLATLLHLKFNVGDLMMLGACIVYAGYTVGLKWKPPLHWKSLMAATAAGAIIASLPLTGWEIASGNAISPDAIGWMIVAFAAVIPSLLSQILYVKGIELIGPNRAGLFINTIPVFGTAMSVLVLGERLQSFHIVALLLVLTGIFIAERARL